MVGHWKLRMRAVAPDDTVVLIYTFYLFIKYKIWQKYEERPV